MHRQALKDREKRLGLDHPDTLISVHNLAVVLRHQGNYEEAESTSRRALEGEEKSLGLLHPGTLMSVWNLAYLFYDQGDYDQATSLTQRAFAGFQKTLGADHPRTQSCSKDLLRFSLKLEEQKRAAGESAVSSAVQTEAIEKLSYRGAHMFSRVRVLFPRRKRQQ